METTLLLVDDHAIVRSGLRLLLEKQPDLRVVGEAGDGQVAIELAQELSPDVVVMDISMPNMDGIEATQRILDESPGIKVIVLSIHGDKRYVKDMLQAGAAGYLLKESVPEELVRGIRAVSRGEIFLSDAITDVVVGQYIDLLTESPPEALESIKITKLLRPQSAQHTISRPRLLSQFEGWRQRPLTLVAAPAGYGKSTAVSQWLESCGSPAVWLSLDEGDNDLRIFLSYLVSAIQTQFPELLQTMAPILKAPVLSPMPVLVNTLVNELASCPQFCILVLDDYHVIVDQAIHELLSELLRQPPRSLHLVLITRTDPPLDLLKLRAYDQIGEVRAEALGFSFEETATYLEQVLGRSVEKAVVEALLAKTEGWVTGLRLITLAASDDIDLVNASTVLHGELQTLDYLIAEALSRQPRDMQAWLLKTSILDRFCASLCEAVFAPPDGGGFGGEAFIRSLTENNLFAIPLDHQGGWYRYHHLFGQLLRRQLGNSLEADEVAALHIQASRWFVDNGMIEQAIKHAIQGEDLDAAARIVTQNRYAILNEDRWYVLDTWLAMLPQEVVYKWPELLLAQAWIAFSSLDYPALVSILEKVERATNGDGLSDALQGELDFLRGHLTYFQGQGSQAEAYLESAIVKIPETNYRVWAEAVLHYALALHMNGRREMALDRLNSLINYQSRRNSIVSTRLWFGLYLIHWSDGNLAEAILAAHKVKEIASKDDNRYAETWGFYIEACAYLYQNDLESAVEELDNLVANRYIVHARAAIDGLCALCLTYQQLQRPEQADATVSLVLEFATQMDNPVYETISSSLQARLSLLRGDSAKGLQWLQKFDLATDPGTMFSWLETPRITACRVLIAQGQPESLQQAVERLQTYREENQTSHNSYQVIVILPLLALAYHKQGNDKQALAVLEEALVLAKPGGWIWPFVELGAPMAILLRRLNKQGVASELTYYVEQLLAAFASPASSSPRNRQPDDIDALTERELQVVRLLATELRIEEIASQLSIGVGTVRSHTKNIYIKLDAHSRIEAVVRAQEMDLI